MPKKRAPKKLQTGFSKKSAKKLELIVIDQEPLRKDTASECSRAMTQLEKARAEWRRFDREDRPAFERWMAATFGGMLTRIREVEAQVGQKEMFIAEVEMEMMFGPRGGYGAAYLRVMKHHAAPQKEPESFDDGPPPKDEGEWAGEDPEADLDEEEMNPFEEELLFEHFARTCMGIEPDRLSDREYERLLNDFRENVLKKKKTHQPPPPPRDSTFGSAPQPAVKPEAPRIKELYRLLVRRLHPDLRADRDAEVSHFWHDVQDAYEQGNVERLEMLLALTDLQSNAVGDHTSLFQMRSALKELRKAFQALQRSLAEAKKDPAWKFAALTNRQQIRAGIQRSLERDLNDHRADLARLDAHIARWKAAADRIKSRRGKPPPKQKPPPPSKMPRNNGPASRYTQTGFSF
jgi:hypothetical protein